MIPPRPIGWNPVYLTCAEVAKRHNTSRQQIARMCRDGGIFPVLHDGTKWLISDSYVIVVTIGGKGGRPTIEKPPKRTTRGRPPGSKNKRPYPTGVKRPRRTHA